MGSKNNYIKMNLTEHFMNITQQKTKKEVSLIVESMNTHQIKNILDLGANVGMFSLYFAKLCPDSIIHSFEPVPLTYQVLKKNIEINNFKNIKINNFGISNKSEQLELGIPRERNDLDNIGLYSVYENSSNKGKAIQIGNFIQLREYTDNLNLKSFDIIKMDVEGCELMILEDNLELFKNSKAVHMECNSKYVTNTIKIKSYLTDFGYKYIMNTHGGNELWIK
jgi:FkbM family methyltransferase